MGDITFTGALTISGQTNVHIYSDTGAVLTSNRGFTADSGGMINIGSGSDVTFTGVGFVSGSAAAQGGCLYIDSSTVEINSVDFDACTSTDNYGGAIFMDSASAAVTESSFKSCSGNAAGAIYAYEGRTGGEEGGRGPPYVSLHQPPPPHPHHSHLASNLR